MHGLSEDVDLSFLLGQELQRIGIGKRRKGWIAVSLVFIDKAVQISSGGGLVCLPDFLYLPDFLCR